MANTIPIPGPPGLPILGNVADVDASNPTASFSQLADTYGRYPSHYASMPIIEQFKLTSEQGKSISSGCQMASDWSSAVKPS